MGCGASSSKTPAAEDESPLAAPTEATPAVSSSAAATATPPTPVSVPMTPSPRVVNATTSSPAAAMAPPEKLHPDGAVIFILGPPGCGKTTLCNSLAERLDGVVLSAPELLRAAVQSASSQGKMIAEMIKSGQIVPVHVTLDLLLAAMRDRRGPYFIDGFPRSTDNLEAFEARIARFSAALALEAEEETLRARLLGRGETSGRTDDNADAITRRLRTYSLQDAQVVAALGARQLLTTIDANASADEVGAAATSACEAAIAADLDS